MSALLDAALGYARRGWHVVPVHEVIEGRCACGKTECNYPGKHPRADHDLEHGLNDATIERVKIESWWARWPNANVGVATGELSDLTVVDVDVSDGKPGLANFTKLCVPHDGVPPTLRARTGSGGFHYFFKYSPALPTRNDCLAEAVDVKSAGGLVVAPPSVHHSGRRYAFENEGADVLALPDWMRPEAHKGRKKKTGRQAKRKTLTLEQTKAALAHINADDRDRWLKMGVILGRTYSRCEPAWEMYVEWAKTSPKYDEDRAGSMKRMYEAFYKTSLEAPRRGGEELSMGSLIQWARDGGWGPQQDLSELDNFYAIHPDGKILYVPSGQLWTPQTVDSILPPVELGHDEESGESIFQAPSRWLAQNRGVETQCFDPALPQINKNLIAREQGVIEFEGATMFNRYRPSAVKLGDARAATPFVDHVRRLFPKTAEADHLLAWLAQRVQRPGVKVRHALLIGGPQGIGKDTIIEACLPALGEWNCASIAPDQIFSQFNEYKAAVLVRINEVADLHDISRYKFYEATKNLISGTPDGTEVNPKYGHKFYVRNCAGVVVTTNYIDTGIYLPADDRRYYAVETINHLEDRDAYFARLWGWLLTGGFAHVAAFLHEFDLSGFNPDAPPPKTETFQRIVDNSKGSDAWLMDALDKLPQPVRMVRADTLRAAVDTRDLSPNEISARLNAAMARLGYETYPDATQPDRRHRLKCPGGGDALRRVVVYVARDVPHAERKAMVAGLPLPPTGF